MELEGVLGLVYMLRDSPCSSSIDGHVCSALRDFTEMSEEKAHLLPKSTAGSNELFEISL